MKALLAALILAACTKVMGATPLAPSFDGPGRSTPSFEGPGYGPADIRSFDGPAHVESLGDRR